jgi:Kef-type K+ transport system membrane component KefB
MEHEISKLLIIGLLAVVSLYVGKSAKWMRLPSIIGYMLVGVLLGPSLFDILSDHAQESLSFISHIALGFVALTIGLELSFYELKKQGPGIILVIVAESFAAFMLVTLAIYLLTRNLPLSLIFGAIAPASAPAGTVAVILEYKAKGSLTKALYAVVGFDDGLGIVIFGFASALARALLQYQAGAEAEPLTLILLKPLLEIFASFGVGAVMALLYCILGRRLKNSQDLFILTFGFVLAVTGLCIAFHLSLILTNMVVGLVVVNTQPHNFTQRIGAQLSNTMPLLFILFFTMAGANLHIGALPSLGLIGLVYAVSRGAGLIGGAYIGSAIGRLEDKIRKYLGFGILSQAGVAIGLSLVVVHEFAGLGEKLADGRTVGDSIGTTVLTTITATCIFFELIGPVCTKIALQKAGEIPKSP